jgi:hypothetical protein
MVLPHPCLLPKDKGNYPPSLERPGVELVEWSADNTERSERPSFSQGEKVRMRAS